MKVAARFEKEKGGVEDSFLRQRILRVFWHGVEMKKVEAVGVVGNK